MQDSVNTTETTTLVIVTQPYILLWKKKKVMLHGSLQVHSLKGKSSNTTTATQPLRDNKERKPELL